MRHDATEKHSEAIDETMQGNLMPDHAGQNSHHAPLVLPDNRERALRVMGYDLFMFVQLVMFHVLCATLGLACYILDRITFGTRFIDAFIESFDKMSRLGHKS